jgi:hypothetical protein
MLISRRQFLQVTGTAIAGLSAPSLFATKEEETDTIRAFRVDFNWDHDIKWEGQPWAQPGQWAKANPAEHVCWYKELGCNTIVTFAVSCNGYAWYKNGIVPAQPGLKHNFLTDIVRLGHEQGMKVFGYFCFGANWLWLQNNPLENYKDHAHSCHIPFTNRYLDYLCASVEDAFQKTGMDGLQIDWLWNPNENQWLPCEQKMYVELMGEKFPGVDKITKQQLSVFRKKSLNRCWQRVYEMTKSIDKNNIIWHSINDPDHPDLFEEAEPILMLHQSDWLSHETCNLELLKKIASKTGKQTRHVICMAKHDKQDIINTVNEIDNSKLDIGLYSFARPINGTLPPPVSHYLSNPIDFFNGDDKNIAIFARVYNKLPLDYIQK